MIRVQGVDFDPGAEIDKLLHGRTAVGGVASFIGVVRDDPHGPTLRAMTLEHYPGMTERMLAAIEQKRIGGGASPRASSSIVTDAWFQEIALSW